MTKILKKIQLSSDQNISLGTDLTKGTQSNPYTEQEMAQLQEQKVWSGGYVETIGYAAPAMTSSGSISSGCGSCSLENLLTQLEFSDFEQKCLRHYYFGNGSDLQLTAAEWSMVCNAIPSSVDYKKGSKITLNNIIYYKCSVSFYQNADLNYAFGTATVTFNESGNPVGIFDQYDFNPQNWGQRPIIAEIFTRIMAQTPGTEYRITYGVY